MLTFVNFFDIFIFVVICLVQLCITIARNGMFYEKHKSSYLVTIFLLCNRYRVFYSWKTLINFWPILMMLYVKSKYIYILLSHVVFNLTIKWPPGTTLVTQIMLSSYVQTKGYYIVSSHLFCNFVRLRESTSKGTSLRHFSHKSQEKTIISRTELKAREWIMEVQCQSKTLLHFPVVS